MQLRVVLRLLMDLAADLVGEATAAWNWMESGSVFTPVRSAANINLQGLGGIDSLLDLATVGRLNIKIPEACFACLCKTSKPYSVWVFSTFFAFTATWRLADPAFE